MVLIMGRRRAWIWRTETYSHTVNKVRELRKIIDDEKLDVIIEIDGGINLDNVEGIVEAGVDWIVAGSAIFKMILPQIQRHLSRKYTNKHTSKGYYQCDTQT